VKQSQIMPAHLKNWRYWFIWFNYRYLYFKLANRDRENRGEKKLSAPWLEQLEVLRQNLGQQYVFYTLFHVIIIKRALLGIILIGAGSKPTGQVIVPIHDTAKFFQFNDSIHNFVHRRKTLQMVTALARLESRSGKTWSEKIEPTRKKSYFRGIKLVSAK
jgi:hypothetical protein